MDYLTNYYKNLSEQLQAKVNHLQRYLAEELGAESQETMGDDVFAGVSGNKPSGQTKGTPTEKDTGTKEKYVNPARAKDPPRTPKPVPHGQMPPENPYKRGTKEWRQWYYQPGHWSYDNPYPYGTKEWFKWESDPVD
jgi:hypothetical protein